MPPKCPSFKESSGSYSCPKANAALLSAEWVTKLCVWACGNVGCDAASTHGDRLLLKG